MISSAPSASIRRRILRRLFVKQARGRKSQIWHVRTSGPLRNVGACHREQYQEKRCGTISCFFERYGIISCVRGAVLWHILYFVDTGMGIDLNPGLVMMTFGTRKKAGTHEVIQ
jgi:hypothetical protein